MSVSEAPIIAIVDDDASVRRSLLRVVQAAGYKAEVFASAGEFLGWLPRNRAACLVLDVHMAEMNGFDLQERLAVPIIFMTAHDDPATRERIVKSRVAGHLRKPFDERLVLDAIARAVAGSQASVAGSVDGHAVDGNGVDGHGVDGNGVDGHGVDGARRPTKGNSDGRR